MLIFMNSPGADLLSQMTAEDDSSQETLSDSTLKPSDRKTKRRERNRVAAQKSRKKQTERADVLHQELETLEKSNLAYLKEIENLKKEINHYNDVLREHESKCLLQNPDAQDLNMLHLGKNEVTNEMDILSLCLSDLIYPVS
ncbi:basic leucine zipper transcriptional factor ATF-like 3 [Polypterus senegalus]|uniref:basic leucine zipper transcriptional factor ATF-like 3 n=1 Tax=Polypterus senegalus TaxID=55291 RepID=UPI0019625881|nr:basic leucine zipper transcriptional factor ATF-like 3 [Polypterus senegalus]